MHAVIYCRVSSQEQGNNLSLPTQEKYCREYCRREGFSAHKVFIERGESARTIERPQFREMLAYCRKHKDSVNAVVVYSLTRFSRNNTDLDIFLSSTSEDLGLHRSIVTKAIGEME